MKTIRIGFTMFFFLLVIFSFGQNITGKASFYANKFHGKKTSSGVPYDKNAYTCAHRKQPFGSWIKVRSIKNDKVVYVKVTDRGPFVKGRIIDLSYAAAKKIGLTSQGVGSVELTYLGKNVKIIDGKIIDNENITDSIEVIKIVPNNTIIKIKADSVKSTLNEK